MSKILIIGSNGYIGRSLSNQLKKKFKLILPSHKQGEIDVLKKKTIEKYINSDLKIIINLSGQVSSKNKNYKKIIVDGNKNIVDILSKYKTNILYFFISSCLVYGYKKKPANEHALLKPKSLYSKLKLNAEKYIKKNLKKYRILRIANVYNDSIQNGFFKKPFESLLKNRTIEFSNFQTQRNMIHLEDVSRSIMLTINNKKLNIIDKLVMNIGHENIKLLKVKNFFLSKLKKKIKIKNKQILPSKDSSQKISIKKQKKYINFEKKEFLNSLHKVIKKYEKYI